MVFTLLSWKKHDCRSRDICFFLKTQTTIKFYTEISDIRARLNQCILIQDKRTKISMYEGFGYQEELGLVKIDW